MFPLTMTTGINFDMGTMGRIFAPHFQAPAGNTGIVPPNRIPGMGFEPRPVQVDEAMSHFINPPQNTGIVPPGRFPRIGFQNRPGNSGVVPPRHHRLMGLRRWHVHQPVGIMLGDDLPSFTSLPSSSAFDMLPTALPQPLPSMQTTAPAASGGWADVFGSLLGKTVQMGSAYELNRLNMNLLSKQYSPSNVQTAIGAYQGQTAVTAAQAQAEMMNRQLEYERTAGTRSGNVMSTGLIVAGLAGLLVVMMMKKKPASAKAA